MTVRADILRTLAASNNASAERAVEEALQAATGREADELAEVLLERNRRSGWVALIRSFHRLAPGTQEKLLTRPRDLFGPLAETMQDAQGLARENVIAIVQRCTDVRLVYLLAEALMDARPEVRAIAGNSLLEAVRRHWNAARAGPEASRPEPEEYEQLRKAVDLGVRHYKNHRQTSTLLAALIHERRQDADLWLLFQDPYDDRTRSATVLLRAPGEPALAVAVLLALGSPLKPAAMAGLAAVETPAVAAVIAAESYRLLDPVLREGAQGVAHLKMLPAMRKELPWNITNWYSWLRLIELVRLQPAEKLNWLIRFVQSAPPGPESCAWKICAARAVAETGLGDAAFTLATLACDPDERVARCAGRFLLNRRHPEWREHAAGVLTMSPHASVRRLLTYHRAARGDPAGAAARTSAARGFERAWSSFQNMPPVVQHATARSLATDPALDEQLRVKFLGTVQEVAQALRMISALSNLAPYRNQIISLCGHADPRIAATAVRLAGRLEDPRLKDLLEAAARHEDARVRASAVESMEELNIAHRSQQVLAMLNSRHSRERANAIKALGRFNFATARECLERMLTDGNPLHRMSALWVVEQFRLLEILRQVSRMARRDPNLRVRRRAAEMLDSLSGVIAASS
jgi:hypothetical protein